MNSKHVSGTTQPAHLRADLLARRAAALAQPLAPSEPVPGLLTLLTFRIAASTYAVNLSEVGEVVPPLIPSPVPGAPASVAGLMQLHGELLPVYHLGALVGSGSFADPEGPVVILRPDGRRQRFGLLVSEVGEVLTAAPDEVRTMHGSAREAGRLVGESTVVIDVEQLARLLRNGKEEG